MVRMSKIAPQGVFEDNEIFYIAMHDEPYERHFDDYSRNWEECGESLFA